MMPMKSDIIAPNTGPYAAAGKAELTQQSVLESNRRADKKAADKKLKQERDWDKIHALETPWINNSKEYKVKKDDFLKKIVEYQRVNGGIDLTDPELSMGYHELQQYALQTQQVKGYFDEMEKSYKTKEHDDISYASARLKLNDAKTLEEQMQAIATIEQEGGAISARPLDYGAAGENLAKNVNLLKEEAKSFKNSTTIETTLTRAKDDMYRLARDQYQTELGLKEWAYNMQGVKSSIPEVNVELTQLNKDGKIEPVTGPDGNPLVVTNESLKQSYDDQVAAIQAEPGSQEYNQEVGRILKETQDLYIKAVAQEYETEYVSNLQKHYYSASGGKKTPPVKTVINANKDAKAFGYNTTTGKKEYTPYYADLINSPKINMSGVKAVDGQTGFNDGTATRFYSHDGTPENSFFIMNTKKPSGEGYGVWKSKLNANQLAVLEKAEEKVGQSQEELMEGISEDVINDISGLSDAEKKVLSAMKDSYSGYKSGGEVDVTIPYGDFISRFQAEGGDVGVIDEIMANAKSKSFSSTSNNAPKKGAIENGHEFLGGDPADSKNWKKVK